MLSIKRLWEAATRALRLLSRRPRPFTIDDYVDNIRVFEFRRARVGGEGSKKSQWQATMKVGEVKIDFTPERTLPHAIRPGRTRWVCRTLRVVHASPDGRHYVIVVEPQTSMEKDED